MENENRLIYANDIEDKLWKLRKGHRRVEEKCAINGCILEIQNTPTADAVAVARIEEVQREILQTLDTLIATHRDISNSQFSHCENGLDIPNSSNDYYGIYAYTMEIARRLVNAALTDLCENSSTKRDGDGNGNKNS